jgi:hypothetical protein
MRVLFCVRAMSSVQIAARTKSSRKTSRCRNRGTDGNRRRQLPAKTCNEVIESSAHLKLASGVAAAWRPPNALD